MRKSSHIDRHGNAAMVDVSEKSETVRRATASVEVYLNEAAFQAVLNNSAAKGDVLAAARLAGIQAAKRTWELIPLCHQISLDHCAVEFTLEAERCRILIISRVKTVARTGVEMEALTSSAVAALTVYDMLKAIQKDIVIANLQLLEKKGGKSGDFIKPDFQNLHIG